MFYLYFFLFVCQIIFSSVVINLQKGPLESRLVLLVELLLVEQVYLATSISEQSLHSWTEE